MTVRVLLTEQTEPVEFECDYWAITEQGHVMCCTPYGVWYVNRSAWTQVDGPTEGNAGTVQRWSA